MSAIQPLPSVLAADDVRVTRLGREGHARWDAFMSNCPDASVYHLSSWRSLIERRFGHQTYYLQAEDGDGHLVGGLPLVRLRSLLFGDYMVSLPYFNYGGVVAGSPVIEQRLMDAAGELAREVGVSHVEFRETRPRNGFALRSDKLTMVLQLPESPEQLWQALGSKRRAQIRRPLREGLELCWGGAELVGEFYQVFARNMRDLGTPVYSREFFTDIAETFPLSAHVLLVRQGKRVIAGAFLIGHRDTVEIPWAASLPEAKPLGVNMLLYWEVISRTIEAGYGRFDFGRCSRGSGTHRFKQQWWGIEVPLYWHYWLGEGGKIPQLTPANPRYRSAIALWRRLPLFVTNTAGPLIVRGLP